MCKGGLEKECVCDLKIIEKKVRDKDFVLIKLLPFQGLGCGEGAEAQCDYHWTLNSV